MSGEPRQMADLSFEVRDGGSFLFERAGACRIFTPETLTDEQRDMRAMARKFADREILPRVDAIEAKTPGLMRELLEKAGEAGLLMLDVPEKYGGLEQNKATTMLITETLTRCASFAVSLGAHVGIGSLPLVYFGTVAQKERYLPKLATGELIAAYALTEPGSGSDALAAKTRADLDDTGESYVLNGSKQWITNAGFADLFVVFAQVAGEHFTAFLVERATPGFEVGPEEHKHGIKGSSTCPLTLTDVKVPVGNVLGEVGKGHHIAFNILNVGRARLGVGSVGAAKYALGLAAKYAAERKQFGRALDGFGLIRAKLGEMAQRIYAGESLGYRTAGLIDRKYQTLEAHSPGPDDADFQTAVEEYTIEASILKVFGSEVLDFVADEALQIHGGYGYMTEYAIERVSRDARINRIFEGTNEINRMLTSGTLLKRGMRQRLPLMKHFGATAAALSAGNVPELDPIGERLRAEQLQVHRMKLATLYVMQQAAGRWMVKIQEEQEVLGALADMIAEVYAADSCVTRALQLADDAPRRGFHEDCATLAVERSRDLVFALAKQVLCAACADAKLDAALTALGLLDHWRPLDVFRVRDRIAAAVVEGSGWPL